VIRAASSWRVASVVWTPDRRSSGSSAPRPSYRADAPPSIDEFTALVGRHGIEPAEPIPAWL
jgi:hypothetical protein